MSCETCGHTMHQIEHEAAEGWDRYRFHCPRCGTYLERTVPRAGYPQTARPDILTVPKLVERCREFEAEVVGPSISTEGPNAVYAEWRRLGLAESINPPDRRPGHSDYCPGCGGRKGSSCDCHPPGPMLPGVELSGR